MKIYIKYPPPIPYSISCLADGTLHNKFYREQQKPPLRYLWQLTSVSPSDVRPTSCLTKDAELVTQSKFLDDKMSH